MNDKNFLNYITTSLSESSDRIKKVHKKVKHGKLKVQRKKVKAQVMKDSNPTDYKRLSICKKARKKAHNTVANTRRDISNEVRKNIKEEMTEWKPITNSFKLSEAYGFDFIEEAVGYGAVDVEFFDKPMTTPITEGLVVGKTKTGRDRKCKAIGIAEGVFAPITDAEGNRVFSRNHRLYEEDHWDYQLENQILSDRVATRRMLGTIGHHDKRVDDEDLAEGKVSHVVTDLEIREDSENGRYLWGRLEILNTPAGKLLKEYYDNDIPLFVSSRGGGKLLESGEGYKVVDKARYFCETFDVVKEPGYLEACPKYIAEAESDTVAQLELLVKEIAQKTGLVVENLSTVSESIEDSNKTEKDSNMKNIDCNVQAGDGVEAILAKIVKPLAESMQELTKTVEKIQADLYESEEASVEEVTTEEVVKEEVSEEVSEEQSSEEVSAVEEPAQEVKAEEAVVEEKEEPATEQAEEVKEEPVVEEQEVQEEAKSEETVEEVVEAKEEKEDDKKEEKEEKPSDEKEEVKECSEAAPEVEEEKTEEVVEACEKCGEKECKCNKEDCKCEKEEEKEEPVKEEWAKEDPKETVSKISEMPSGDEPKKTELENKLEAEIHAEEAKDLKAAAIKEEAEEAAEEVPAGMEEVTDYKKMYEGLQAEVDEAINEVNKMVETFKEFGKKYTEVVTEKEESISSLTEQLEKAEKELNSYKLSEKFNVTVEEANEMLSSKSYEAVEEELKEAEATKLQEEAQAKVEQVSESIQSDVETIEAPVSKKRKAYSAFSAQPVEKISESEEIKPVRKAFSWFN